MNLKTRALIGFILALPGAILIMLLLFQIEPNFWSLQSWLAGSPNPDDGPGPGSIIALIALVPLPLIALILNLAPIRQDMRSGRSMFIYLVNLAVALIALTVLVLFTGGLIIDQYPCWQGVPNCD